jgi:hypothetical protein
VQGSGPSAMEDLHQTSLKKVSSSFPCMCLERVVYVLGGRLKGHFFKVKICMQIRP